MNKILKTSIAFGAAILMWSSSTAQTHAAGDTEKNIRACRTAMAASMNFDTSMRGDNYYKLRKIRGTNLQKLTFVSSKKTGRKTIICSVKRREVLELTDEKKRSLN